MTLNGEPLKTRDGTDVDKNTLKQTFERFGFRTFVFGDLNHNEITAKIRKVMQDFKKDDCCFIVCILSHGQLGKTLKVQNRYVSVYPLP